jgi:hypothetical protein
MAGKHVDEDKRPSKVFRGRIYQNVHTRKFLDHWDKKRMVKEEVKQRFLDGALHNIDDDRQECAKVTTTDQYTHCKLI